MRGAKFDEGNSRLNSHKNPSSRWRIPEECLHERDPETKATRWLTDGFEPCAFFCKKPLLE